MFPARRLLEKSSRIPSLDGLRAVALSLVLFGHLCGTPGFLPRSAASVLGDLANLGVHVFFIISGFLITSLLLAELDQTGVISLKSFYLRRTIRIFPAFYVYLTILVGAAAFGWVHLRPGDLLHAVTYTSNYHPIHSWLTGHLWSLSVEEQFYLLWPIVFALGGAHRAKWVAAMTIAAAPLCRAAMMVYLPEAEYGIGWWFPTIADSIAAGCLLALWKQSLEENPFYKVLLRSRWFFLLIVAVVAMNMKAGGRLRVVLIESILNIAICVIIHRTVLAQKSLWSRTLNTGALSFGGALSYSVYLWQQPFLNRYGSSPLQAFPLNLILAVACGAASFYLIETPMLRLRNRLPKERTKKLRVDEAVALP
ncbi:MAG TPA: acyltransferase [Bryobacteraceae bacterium]|nr:acyltransferase [Bryobacteraceae bacterium]